MKTIGIVGYGFLGRAFEYVFAPKCNIMINDVARKEDNIKFFSKEDLVKKCDLILVGVPTPHSKTKGYIPDIIDNVLKELSGHAFRARKDVTVLIKSAVLPSHVKTFKNYHLDVLVSPEYLSGANSIADNVHSNIHIIGGSEKGFMIIEDLIMNHSILNSTWSSPKLRHVSAVDGALIKYMENCFLALKCTILSEFYQLHEEIKTSDSKSFNEVIEAFQLDPRMGVYPYKIPYNEELGYCSHCLCKDTQSIMDEFKNHNVNFDILNAMHEKNKILRSNLTEPHKKCENTPGGVIN